jgi:hypothetical protein
MPPGSELPGGQSAGESVQEFPQLEQAVQLQPRNIDQLHLAGFFGRHPSREEVLHPVCSADHQMGRAIMLEIGENEEALSGERMKTISDYDFRRRNPGIMSPLQMAERGTGRWR